MMLTSRAGRSIKGNDPYGTSLSSTRGMTLLEIIIVLAILSVILLISIPKIPYVSDYSLKKEARHLSGLFRFLDESATTKKIYYKVRILPETDRISVESSVDGVVFVAVKDQTLKRLSLKRQTEIEDINVAGLGLVKKGEVDLFFNPVYGADPFSLHIKGNGKTYTINYNPYSGRVKVIEGSV